MTIVMVMFSVATAPASPPVILSRRPGMFYTRPQTTVEKYRPMTHVRLYRPCDAIKSRDIIARQSRSCVIALNQVESILFTSSARFINPQVSFMSLYCSEILYLLTGDNALEFLGDEEKC